MRSLGKQLLLKVQSSRDRTWPDKVGLLQPVWGNSPQSKGFFPPVSPSQSPSTLPQCLHSIADLIQPVSTTNISEGTASRNASSHTKYLMDAVLQVPKKSSSNSSKKTFYVQNKNFQVSYLPSTFLLPLFHIWIKGYSSLFFISHV